jgi:hypothetical protein
MTRLVLSACAALALVACKSAPRTDAASSSAALNQPAHVAISPAPPGAVAEIVRAALARANGERRKLLVYVGATWCEPCQRFHHAAEAGELDATFPDLTLLEFDADRDHGRLAEAGYKATYIPLFVLPNADGTSSGQQIEGSIKGDGAVRQITPRLKGLLER